jgi:hypothetical protein
MDISSVKKESFGRANFWLLVIDEATNCAWSLFITKKNMTQQKISELVGFINEMGDRKVKFIRCDNAGENTQRQKKFSLRQDMELSLSSLHLAHHNRMETLKGSLQH